MVLQPHYCLIMEFRVVSSWFGLRIMNSVKHPITSPNSPHYPDISPALLFVCCEREFLMMYTQTIMPNEINSILASSLILIILYAKSFNFNNDILLSRAFQLSSNIKSRINFLLNTRTLCKTALNGLWGLGTVKANMILCHNIILSIIKIEWDRQDLHLNFFRQSRENYLMSSI